MPSQVEALIGRASAGFDEDEDAAGGDSALDVSANWPFGAIFSGSCCSRLISSRGCGDGEGYPACC